MNFTRTHKQLILAHKKMEQVKLTEVVNVMLTPQFYTVKKEFLPVKYAYQAKAIAPALFDGLLEDGINGYDFLVWREEEIWVVIAYNMEKIVDFLLSKGLEQEKIGKIFFVEQVRERFTSALLLGESDALVVLNNVMVVVPQGLLSQEEKSTSHFDAYFTPKNGVVIRGAYGSVFSLSQTILLSAIFLLFGIMFFVEGSHFADDGETKGQIQTLFEANPTMESSYSRKAIKAKYEKIDKVERTKREVVKALGAMIFKGVSLSALDINEKEFKATFACENIAVKTKLKTLPSPVEIKYIEIAGTNDLIIEGRF